MGSFAGMCRRWALRGASCVLCLLALSACSITHAYRVIDGQRIKVAQMVAELGTTPVVLLGEEHDDMAHHELQLDVIQQMHQGPQPLAIGLEMFEIQHQAALDAWVAGRLPEGAFIPVYQANWRNLSWGYYRAIFIFAREQRIPLIALNAPKNMVQTVAKQGLSGLSDADLRALPGGVNAPLRADEARAATAYGPIHGHNTHATRFIAQAQVFRNRVMAKGIVRYLSQHPQARMAVLTGGLHAWRQGGIPAELEELAHTVILPPMAGMHLMDRSGSSADYVLD